MPKPTRRLGRGLNSLVSDLRAEQGQSPVPATSDREKEGTDTGTVAATMLPVEALRPNPFQPRDSITQATVLSLAQSIRQSGILQPILVRVNDGRHEIIAGQRRWLAARSLGLRQVPVILRDASDEQMLELALIENIQREDLNAIDRARGYRQFCTHFGLKPEEVAARLGEDRTTVVNYLRLLDLPETIRDLVAQGKLSMGHARCLLGIVGESERVRLAEAACENELSVRALEEIVRRRKTRTLDVEPGKQDARQAKSAHLEDLQRRFEDAVKTKVTIHEGKRKGTGRIVIEYFSLDDFDRVAGRLGVNIT